MPLRPRSGVPLVHSQRKSWSSFPRARCLEAEDLAPLRIHPEKRAGMAPSFPAASIP